MLVSYAADVRLAATRPDTRTSPASTWSSRPVARSGGLRQRRGGTAVLEQGLGVRSDAAATPLPLLGSCPLPRAGWVRRYNPVLHGAGAVVSILAMLGSSLALVAAAERGDVIVVAALTATAADVRIMTRTPCDRRAPPPGRWCRGPPGDVVSMESNGRSTAAIASG